MGSKPAGEGPHLRQMFIGAGVGSGIGVLVLGLLGGLVDMPELAKVGAGLGGAIGAAVGERVGKARAAKRSETPPQP